MKHSVLYEEEIRAACQAVTVTDRSLMGRLRIAGRDRLDFLQRMSTNDMSRLTPGQGCVTVLTTAIGRIVDRLTVYAEAETLLALTSEGQAELVRRWLSRHIFFMDQVTLTDETETTGLLALYGPRAGELVQAALGVDATALPRYAWQRTFWNGAEVTIAATEALTPLALLSQSSGRGGMGDESGAFYLIAPAEVVPGLWARLLDAGASLGVRPMGEEAYEALRIAAGQPRFGRELSEEYIPLEAGLWDAVSFSKGCYIGQEIIARMESRGKQARQLVGLRLAALPPAGEVILQASGQRIGRLTSVARLPEGVVGLGYVRTAYATPGTPLSAVAAGQEIAAEISFVVGSSPLAG